MKDAVKNRAEAPQKEGEISAFRATVPLPSVMKHIQTLLVLTVAASAAFAQSHTNPVTLNGEWSSYGIGDPYIMKYRGTYYLYCSTKNRNTGVKCWSTKDFITWSDAITCAEDPVTRTAYAPEVVYWNGTFYMYTSPGGGGHYVLSSDSPTGPFLPVTGNVGRSIDGSVFIDDDGKWYFYRASNNGILGCPMPSPTEFGDEVNLNARMGYGWTEAPCVIKRDGTYYLLYSGNHVLSNGYRVDYGKNTNGAISAYAPRTAQNPILIKTEGSFVGLAHGTAFIGPDLDTYYFTYHNLTGRYPNRNLNFDRIGWNGDKLLLMGPTYWEQQAFQQADRSDFFDRDELGANWLTPNGGNWIIQHRDALLQNAPDAAAEYKALYADPTGENYTAEFTVRGKQPATDAARFGVVFGYSDEAGYGTALLCPSRNALEINFKTDNTWGTPEYYPLPGDCNPNVWHHLRIEKSGATYRFFFDGMLKATAACRPGAGRIGYMTARCHADFGYIAFSNQVNGSGIYDIYKPIPGTVQAVHYNTGGEGAGYHDLTPGNTGGGEVRNDSVDVASCTEGGYAVTDNQAGEWYRYNVNVKSSGLYHLGFRYATGETASRVRIRQGDADLTGTVALPSSGGASRWRTFTIKNLKLSAGFQTIRMEIVNGGLDFYEMEFKEAGTPLVGLTDRFDTAFSEDWNYADGTWNIESGEASLNGYGKRTIGDAGWTDYTVQTDITCLNGYDGGLILRVNNPSQGGAGRDPALGTDYLQAYFIHLLPDGVSLGKHNYSYAPLATATAGKHVPDRKYTLRAVVAGANIKVYVDDMETPKIDYTDPDPIISGKVGLRVRNAHVRFDNFSVTANAGEDTVYNL
ncbi:MAG: family 43 glycosylhydrolase [Bacteroidales bacterium]|nr:family 43 glycosylhydrolase [Bacteroidales bacterium]